MTVIIKEKAHKKIKSYVKQMRKDEIGGLLLGKVDNLGDIIIKDIIILKQYKSRTGFKIDDDAMMDLTKNATNKLLKSIVGWWHSHVDMGTFWSPNDDSCFRRLSMFSGMCVGVVMSMNQKGVFSERWRVDIINKNQNRISIDNIEPEHPMHIHNSYLLDLQSIKNNIKTLVFDDDREWDECPHCHGSGMIETNNTIKIEEEVEEENPIVG